MVLRRVQVPCWVVGGQVVRDSLGLWVYAWVVRYGEMVCGICGVYCLVCGWVGALGYRYFVGIGVSGPGGLSVWLYGTGYVALRGGI